MYALNKSDVPMKNTNPRALISTGNAALDSIRGWFIGQFIPLSSGLAHQEGLEMKWHQHTKGERRREFAQCPKTTIAILVSGSLITRFKLSHTTRKIVLSRPGDYVAYSPGLYHSWEAPEESLVITVRFASTGENQTQVRRRHGVENARVPK